MSRSAKTRTGRTQYFRRHFHNFPSQKPTKPAGPILSPEENAWIERIVARSRRRDIDAA